MVGVQLPAGVDIIAALAVKAQPLLDGAFLSHLLKRVEGRVLAARSTIMVDPTPDVTPVAVDYYKLVKDRGFPQNPDLRVVIPPVKKKMSSFDPAGKELEEKIMVRHSNPSAHT